MLTVTLQNGHCNTENTTSLAGGGYQLIEAATIWERENEPCNEIILRALRLAGFSDRGARGVLALSQAIGPSRHEVRRSQASIARRLHIDESTVSRYLDAIEESQGRSGRVFITIERCRPGDWKKASFTGHVRPTAYEVFKRAVKSGRWKIDWRDAHEATDSLLDSLALEVLSLLPETEIVAYETDSEPDDPDEDHDMVKKLEDRHRKTYVDLGALVDKVDPAITIVALQHFKTEHARKVANLERRIEARLSRQLQEAQRELAPLDFDEEEVQPEGGSSGVSKRNPGVEDTTGGAGSLAGNKIAILKTKDLDAGNEQDPYSNSQESELLEDGYEGSREAEGDENFEPEPSIFEAAERYLKEGFRAVEVYGVEPGQPPRCLCSKGTDCESPGKHPRGLNGVYTQKPPERWAASSNVGIATGNGIVALDIDPRNGGEESLAELRAAGLVTETRIASTGGGGLHFFYSVPAGVKVPSCTLRPGLEIKSDGYMVVAAPSLHASGRRYEWAHEIDMAPLPDDLLDLILATRQAPKSKTVPTAPAEVVFSPSPSLVVYEGERNTRMFRFLCALRGKGCSEDQIRQAAMESNRPPYYPVPLDDDELEKIIRSACRF